MTQAGSSGRLRITIAQKTNARRAGAHRAFKKVAERTGLEPATSNVTGWRSNRLSYHPTRVTLLLIISKELLMGGTGLEPATVSL